MIIFLNQSLISVPLFFILIYKQSHHSGSVRPCCKRGFNLQLNSAKHILAVVTGSVLMQLFVSVKCQLRAHTAITVELRWLEHFRDNGNVFETGIVLTPEPFGYSILGGV